MRRRAVARQAQDFQRTRAYRLVGVAQTLGAGDVHSFIRTVYAHQYVLNLLAFNRHLFQSLIANQ